LYYLHIDISVSDGEGSTEHNADRAIKAITNPEDSTTEFLISCLFVGFYARSSSMQAHLNTY